MCEKEIPTAFGERFFPFFEPVQGFSVHFDNESLGQKLERVAGVGKNGKKPQETKSASQVEQNRQNNLEG